MNKLLTLMAATILSASAFAASSYKGAELAKDARITLPAARALALKAHPGKIVEEELEAEKGGSGLRYTFVIKDKDGKTKQEVGIDAKTGEILENQPEGANPD